MGPDSASLPTATRRLAARRGTLGQPTAARAVIAARAAVRVLVRTRAAGMTLDDAMRRVAQHLDGAHEYPPEPPTRAGEQ